jgi:sporadic carbohydrate cluster 2OG-Fe(II) oxygenase
MEFLKKSEKKIHNMFIKQGYYVFDIDSKLELNFIKKEIFKISRDYLKKKVKLKKINNFFNNTHNFISNIELNNFRVHIYNTINKNKKFRVLYFRMAEKILNIVCGNELAMQNKINISIQMPEDESSLLPIHSDTWSGNSPFELVVWLPLVNCYDTMSMFILPLKDNEYYYENFKKFNSAEKMFRHCKKKLKWIKVNYGQVLIFSQNLLHGNVVNLEKKTRWSFNCRFKSLFAPYHQKRLGEFFSPITMRASSIFGIDYKEPNV